MLARDRCCAAIWREPQARAPAPLFMQVALAPPRILPLPKMDFTLGKVAMSTTSSVDGMPALRLNAHRVTATLSQDNGRLLARNLDMSPVSCWPISNRWTRLTVRHCNCCFICCPVQAEQVRSRHISQVSVAGASVQQASSVVVDSRWNQIRATGQLPHRAAHIRAHAFAVP